MELTVTEAAKIARVTEKTIRAWIVEGGMPLIREGEKGPGNGAIIDAARFPHYLQERRARASSFGDKIRDLGLPCGGNPLRWLVERHHVDALDALATAWRHFLDSGQWNQWDVGLDEQRARTVAWQAWVWCAMWMKIFIADGEFEKRLKRDTDCDLDDWASLLLQSDFSTDWTDLDHVACPPEIAALMPPAMVEKLGDDNVRTLPKRRSKRVRR